MLLKPLLFPTLALAVGVSPASAQTPSQPSAAIAPSASATPNHHLVTIRVRDAASLDRVLALDLDLAACHSLELPTRVLEVIADDRDLQKIRAAGLDYRIEVRNYEDHIEKSLRDFASPFALTPPVGQGAMGGHYTLTQIVAHIDKFAKDHPARCSTKVSLGKSIEGRDIWMVKISDNVNVDENEPEVLFDSLHHAREPLGVTTTLVFMDWLLSNYATDPVAKRIVDTRELYFVPCVNPDGYEYNRSIRPGGGGMWRKNRRNNGSSYGVDLNRNWPTGWSAPNGGNSTNPSSDTYRGTAPLSEPEVKALDNFIKSRNFTLGCSTHTYTDILLRPWGYQRSAPSNEADYKVIDAAATKVNGINAGVTSQVLYIAAGGALDHYHTHGMFGYSPELGRSNEGGFWPNPTNQVAISTRHQDMYRQFALVSGASVEVAEASMTEGPGSNANGIVDPGEIAELRLTMSNSGAVAPITNVVVTAKTLTAGVVVTRASHDFGKIAKFSSSTNTSAPLVIAVSSGFTGSSIKFELDTSYEGNSIKKIVDLPLQQPFEIIGTGFEKDLGFRAGTADTARTGRFERAAPQGTVSSNVVIQPNEDASTVGTKCWVTDARSGSSAGSYDVDGGFTTMLSPIMDLTHVTKPTLEYKLWYAETGSNPDPFTVEISRNGGTSWTEIFRRTATGSNWTAMKYEIPTPITTQMQFRFRAQDTVQASLVEALIDEFRVTGVTEPANASILAGGQRGSTIRFGFHGTTGAVGLPLLSTTSQDVAVPGIEGRLRVGFAGLIVLSPIAYGTSRRIVLDAPIPNDASLSGVRFYWQQLLVRGTQLRLGNLTSLKIQ